jgi:hypothetical protein
MLDTLSEKLKSEAYDWRFKSMPVTKPFWSPSIDHHRPRYLARLVPKVIQNCTK